MTRSTDVVLDGDLLERFRDAATGGAVLTAAEREDLGLITRIGGSFLRYCVRQTVFDLSALRNVTAVGDFFLAGCTRLTTIDLTPLSSITSIGAYFLCANTGLKALDLSPLRHVTEIGDRFLYLCSCLKQIVWSPIGRKKLSYIGNGRDELAICGKYREELAQLLVASNKRRVADVAVSWNARRTALLIRNFAPRDHANDAFKIWNVMRCVVRFASPLQVPDEALITDEVRMLNAVEARGV